MKFTILALAAFAASASALSAATLSATQRSIGNLEGGLEFTVEFDDTNGNRLLEASEVTSFRGFVTGPRPRTFYYDVLLTVPDIPGLSSFGSVPGQEDLPFYLIFPTEGSWQFYGTDRTVSTSQASVSRYNSDGRFWTYKVTGLTDSTPAPVPLPAGLPLILAGLGALRLARRAKA